MTGIFAPQAQENVRAEAPVSAPQTRSPFMSLLNVAGNVFDGSRGVGSSGSDDRAIKQDFDLRAREIAGIVDPVKKRRQLDRLVVEAGTVGLDADDTFVTDTLSRVGLRIDSPAQRAMADQQEVEADPSFDIFMAASRNANPSWTQEDHEAFATSRVMQKRVDQFNIEEGARNWTSNTSKSWINQIDTISETVTGLISGNEFTFDDVSQAELGLLNLKEAMVKPEGVSDEQFAPVQARMQALEAKVEILKTYKKNESAFLADSTASITNEELLNFAQATELAIQQGPANAASYLSVMKVIESGDAASVMTLLENTPLDIKAAAQTVQNHRTSLQQSPELTGDPVSSFERRVNLADTSRSPTSRLNEIDIMIANGVSVEPDAYISAMASGVALTRKGEQKYLANSAFFEKNFLGENAVATRYMSNLLSEGKTQQYNEAVDATREFITAQIEEAKFSAVRIAEELGDLAQFNPETGQLGVNVNELRKVLVERGGGRGLPSLEEFDQNVERFGLEKAVQRVSKRALFGPNGQKNFAQWSAFNSQVQKLSAYQNTLTNFTAPDEVRTSARQAVADPATMLKVSNYDVLREASSILGMNEVAQNAALSSYLLSGGVDIDPSVTAWCAAKVNAVFGRLGIKGTNSLAARSFLDWGVDTSGNPQVGDVVVLSRGSNPNHGHVGFFMGYDENGDIKVLGGNQSNSVNIQSYSSGRLLGFRRPSETQGFTEIPSVTPEDAGELNQIRSALTQPVETEQPLTDSQQPLEGVGVIQSTPTPEEAPKASETPSASSTKYTPESIAKALQNLQGDVTEEELLNLLRGSE